VTVGVTRAVGWQKGAKLLLEKELEGNEVRAKEAGLGVEFSTLMIS
jgi:hypothetical protein